MFFFRKTDRIRHKHPAETPRLPSPRCFKRRVRAPSTWQNSPERVARSWTTDLHTAQPPPSLHQLPSGILRSSTRAQRRLLSVVPPPVEANFTDKRRLLCCPESWQQSPSLRGVVYPSAVLPGWVEIRGHILFIRLDLFTSASLFPPRPLHYLLPFFFRSAALE